MKWFLAGMLAGVIVMGSMWTAIDVYGALNVRISNIEGYLEMMSRMRSHE